MLQRLKKKFHVRFYQDRKYDTMLEVKGERNMKSKKVGEIFSDYNTNSNIKYAEVTALNVVKKTNTLEVILYFDEYIEIKEIWFFEKFLKERFQFEHIDIKINYHEGVGKKTIRRRMEKHYSLYGTQISINQTNVIIKK